MEIVFNFLIIIKIHFFNPITSSSMRHLSPSIDDDEKKQQNQEKTKEEQVVLLVRKQ